MKCARPAVKRASPSIPYMNEDYASGYLLLSGAKIESWGRSGIPLRLTKADRKRLDTTVSAAAPAIPRGTPLRTCRRVNPRFGSFLSFIQSSLLEVEFRYGAIIQVSSRRCKAATGTIRLLHFRLSLE